MKKRFGLALGAGGAKGVAHIGALQALEDNKLKPDIITGCSAGSVVAACYAYGMKPKSIFAECKKLTKTDFVDLNLNVLKGKSVLKSVKFKNIIEKYLGGVLIEQLKLPFACIAADLNTGRLFEFTAGDVTTAIRASCAIPVIFAPVEKDGMLLVDGGILSRTPVKTAKKLGAEVTVAIDVNNKAYYSSTVKNVFEIALRAVDIMEHRSKSCGSARADLTLRPDLKIVDQLAVEKQEYIYKQGYKSIIDNLDKIKSLVG